MTLERLNHIGLSLVAIYIAAGCLYAGAEKLLRALVGPRSRFSEVAA